MSSHVHPQGREPNSFAKAERLLMEARSLSLNVSDLDSNAWAYAHAVDIHRDTISLVQRTENPVIRDIL